MGGRRADGVKRRFWRDAVRRQRASGLSIRAFCLRDGVSEPGFHWWRRQLTRRAALAPKPPASKPMGKPSAYASGAKSRSRRGRRQTAEFLPLTVIPAAATPLIEIALAGGVTIRLHAGAPAPLLREVLAALTAETVKPPGRTVREPRPC
jgi:hypothetical protein